MPIADQPAPPATLATRADGSAWRRACRSGTAGSHSSPSLGGARGIVDLEEPARRPLLEPLPNVPLVGPGLGRKLGRRRRSQALESAVQAEPVPDVDGAQVHETQVASRRRPASASRRAIGSELPGVA
jgi:hypothetical protein